MTTTKEKSVNQLEHCGRVGITPEKYAALLAVAEAADTAVELLDVLINGGYCDSMPQNAQADILKAKKMFRKALSNLNSIKG